MNIFMKKIYEIGAGDQWSSQVINFLKHQPQASIEAWLYEPNPVLYTDLLRSAGQVRNLHMMHTAVHTHDKGDWCYNLGYASFMKGARSFISLSYEENAEEYLKSLRTFVPTITMQQIDPGNIDVLVLTNNGGELDVLSGMSSRPEFIYTKHYVHNEKQTRYYAELGGWLKGNRYVSRTLEMNKYCTFVHLEWRKQ